MIKSSVVSVWLFMTLVGVNTTQVDGYLHVIDIGTYPSTFLHSIVIFNEFQGINHGPYNGIFTLQIETMMVYRKEVDVESLWTFHTTVLGIVPLTLGSITQWEQMTVDLVGPITGDICHYNVLLMTSNSLLHFQTRRRVSLSIKWLFVLLNKWFSQLLTNKEFELLLRYISSGTNSALIVFIILDFILDLHFIN